ncbi:MAG: DUF1080 domain-containing protein [Bacteroides sp.]|jgi:hypothetical protein|nr:DUF1080 domain-containing protein [Bacteroides sp.]
MKKSAIAICLIIMVSNTLAQNFNLDEVETRNNSDLFRIETIDNEKTIILEGNKFDSSIDPFTGMEKSNSRGAKVFLVGEVQTDYVMSTEMRLIKNNLEDCNDCGWLGFAIRTQDFDNFECVWFMPGMSKDNVAYIPFAHGIAPYWGEGYIKSEKGTVKLPQNDWFKTTVVVKGNNISIYVNSELVLKKKASYYLTSGYAGLFVGTATDAAFRKISIEKLE